MNCEWSCRAQSLWVMSITTLNILFRVRPLFESQTYVWWWVESALWQSITNKSYYYLGIADIAAVSAIHFFTYDTVLVMIQAHHLQADSFVSELHYNRCAASFYVLVKKSYSRKVSTLLTSPFISFLTQTWTYTNE